MFYEGVLIHNDELEKMAPKEVGSAETCKIEKNILKHVKISRISTLQVEICSIFSKEFENDDENAWNPQNQLKIIKTKIKQKS